jgi:MFS family permease
MTSPTKPDWQTWRTRTEPGRSLWLCGISTLPAGLHFSVLLGGALTLLAGAAGLSDRQLGLLMALPFATSLIQIPAAYLIDRTGRRKAIFLVSGYLTRFLWFPMALLPVLWGPGDRTARALLLLAATLQLCANVTGPAWQSWLADLVPANARGIFFAWRSRVFSFSMLVGSVIIAWVLPKSPGAPSLSWILLALFGGATIAGLIEIRMYRDIQDAPGPAASGTDWAAFAIPLRNPDFRTFLGFNLLYVAGVALLGPFLWKHFLGELSLDGTRTTLMLQTAPLLATMMISPILGRALDEFGAKPLLRIGVWGGALLPLGWFFIGPSGWVAGLALAWLIQVFWTMVDQANFVLLMRYASRRDGAQPVVYSTIFNLAVALTGALAGYLGGDLAQRLQEWDGLRTLGSRLAPLSFSPYLPILFLSCGLRALAGRLFGRRLAEAEASDTATAFRNVSRRFVASMQTTLLLPVRGIWLVTPRKLRQTLIRLNPNDPPPRR